MMTEEWPDHIEDEDSAEVPYPEEESEAAAREMYLAATRASEALKGMAGAVHACGEAIGRIRDDYVLAQEEIGAG